MTTPSIPPPSWAGGQEEYGDHGQYYDHQDVEQQPHVDEKSQENRLPPKQGADDEEEEDMDALIASLEENEVVAEQDDVEDDAMAPMIVPDELISTDINYGLTNQEVQARLKKYGYNRLSEEKENLVLKFMMFFVGPIQFVMEVSLIGAANLSLFFSLPFSIWLTNTFFGF